MGVVFQAEDTILKRQVALKAMLPALAVSESARSRFQREAITAAQALCAYTYGSAYASKAEHRKGSIEPGKLADFTVLSEDPTAVGSDRIAGLQVLATIIDGEIRYDAGLT